MDIAALSMAMSTAKTVQAVSMAVTKKAMDISEVQMQGMVDMLKGAAPPPSFGHRMDIRA